MRIWADNNFETTHFEVLTIEVIDPCLGAVLTIDNSVFKPAKDLTLLQFV